MSRVKCLLAVGSTSTRIYTNAAFRVSKTNKQVSSSDEKYASRCLRNCHFGGTTILKCLARIVIICYIVREKVLVP